MGYQNSAVGIICDAYEQLSDTDRKIADFLLQNMDEVPSYSVGDIAEGSGTSNATVSRFVRHVGFPSFADMRLAVARESRGEGNPGQAAIPEVSANNISGLLERILEIKMQELRSTVSLLDPKSVSAALDLIGVADTIYFAAVGNSIPVCSNLAFKLGQIGFRTSCPVTTEAMILASLSLRSNDLVVLVSSSGYSRRLQTIVDNAEDSGTPVLMVTANPQSALAKRCDIVLQASSRDQMLAGTQFSSHVSSDFIVEALFTLQLAKINDAEVHALMEHKSLGRDKESRPTFS